MSSFTNALILRDTVDGKNWRVHEGFQYYIGDEGSDAYVDVPEGVKTDLASIPRVLQFLVPKVGKFNQGAVVHDVLYRRGFIEVFGLSGKVSRVDVTREEADEIFLETMKVLNVSKYRRGMIFYGLRAGGWYGWWKNRHRRIMHRTFYDQSGRVLVA